MMTTQKQQQQPPRRGGVLTTTTTYYGTVEVCSTCSSSSNDDAAIAVAVDVATDDNDDDGVDDNNGADAGSFRGGGGVSINISRISVVLLLLTVIVAVAGVSTGIFYFIVNNTNNANASITSHREGTTSLASKIVSPTTTDVTKQQQQQQHHHDEKYKTKRDDNNDNDNSYYLMLLRHAKSSWDNDAIIPNDFDRPLSKIGIGAAKLVGRNLSPSNFDIALPDLILCSPSVRTRQTLGIVLNQWMPGGTTLPPIIEYDDELYNLALDDGDADDNGSSGYLRYLQNKLSNSNYHRVLIVGHNPAMEHLFNALININTDEKKNKDGWRKFPAGALCEIEFRNSKTNNNDRYWGDLLQPGLVGKLTLFLNPKTLLKKKNIIL